MELIAGFLFLCVAGGSGRTRMSLRELLAAEQSSELLPWVFNESPSDFVAASG